MVTVHVGTRLQWSLASGLEGAAGYGASRKIPALGIEGWHADIFGLRLLSALESSLVFSVGRHIFSEQFCRGSKSFDRRAPSVIIENNSH